MRARGSCKSTICVMFSKRLFFIILTLTKHYKSVCTGPPGYTYLEEFDIWIKYNKKYDSWSNHEKSCQADDQRSHLITIDSVEKNTIIHGFLSSHTAIGLARRKDDAVGGELYHSIFPTF